MEEIKIRPIGRVKSNFKNTPPLRKSWGDVISKIIIRPEFSQCLAGLEKYSHIIVLYWMHKVRRNKPVFSKGVLASRLPFRPNPIGLTIAELLERKGNILIVSGLDAFDGSPVIDIKPYTGHPRDLVLDFKSPDKF